MQPANPPTSHLTDEELLGAQLNAPKRGMAWLRAQLQRAIIPALVIVGILVVWEVVELILKVPVYVLPRPSVIGHAIIVNRALLLRHLVPTVEEALLGFLIGNSLAVLLAISFVYSRTLERSLYPVAITLRSIPVVAITPLLLLWLGNGIAPKVAIAALSAFFPTLVNMVQGLTSVETPALELMHTLSANRRQIFTKMRWPAALPYLFSALKIASASSVLGAIVAEWIGSDKGLGYLIVVSTFEFRIELLWANIAIASLLAVLSFALVGAIERRVVWWKDTPAEPESGA